VSDPRRTNWAQEKARGTLGQLAQRRTRRNRNCGTPRAHFSCFGKEQIWVICRAWSLGFNRSDWINEYSLGLVTVPIWA